MLYGIKRYTMGDLRIYYTGYSSIRWGIYKYRVGDILLGRWEGGEGGGGGIKIGLLER